MPQTITRIPEHYRQGLAKIKALPIDTVAKIVEAWKTAPPKSKPGELTALAERAGQLSPEDAASIVSSLRSLYIFRAKAECPVPELVRLVVSAMQSTGGVVALSEQEKDAVADKLLQLLGLGSLGLDYKVEQLKTDYQLLFFDAKILTDLRPVFDKTGEPPIGAIITNTLKIVSHASGEHEELYFALDAEDVMALSKITDRAKEKIASLKEFMQSANLPDLS